MSTRLEKVFAYHDATKHHFHSYAPGPGSLDWATQPDPFRRYAGCDILALDKFPHADGPTYASALIEGGVASASLTRENIARLFYDSMALSAWKQAGQTRWALRVNPSSGNLHPTEVYLVSGPVPGLFDLPAVCHYAPSIHALEVRHCFPLALWRDLLVDLPSSSVIVGLSSIYWREAWKYGSRAFRYCQHDTGHAIAAISYAAAALGWKVVLLDNLSDESVAALLGLPRDHQPEAERPECLLAVYPQTQTCPTRGLPKAVIQTLAQGEWHGAPNILSPDHRSWPIIDEVDEATRKPDTSEADDVAAEKILADPMIIDAPTVLFRHLIHRRRSAVAMDGVTTLSCAAFYSILQDCLPHAYHFPFNALPWPPKVDLLLFVHRVQDVTPGLYLLVRDPSRLTEQQQAFGREFEWIKPKDCPAGLSLYRLAGGDCRALAQRLGCHQDIAADGAFAVAMLAEFEPALKNYGAWFYRRLYWECGAIGQMLYLAAEARDIQATGIGCFFDDAVHEALGLQDRRYQSLYHFTLGGGVEDTRLTSLPPYPEEGQR